MVNQNNILSILIALSIVSCLTLVTTAMDNNVSNNVENEINSSNEEKSAPVPAGLNTSKWKYLEYEIDSSGEMIITMPIFELFENDSMDSVKNESWCLATRGTFPKTLNETEKIEWLHTMYTCYWNLTGIQQYREEAGGPILTINIKSEKGYLEVGIDSRFPEKRNDSFYNEIYQLIAEQYEKESIHDVPVVFVELTTLPPITEEEEISEILTDENNEDKVAQQAPGFTSFVLVMYLAIVTGFKRKKLKP